jgi:hypothetical protein
MDTNEQLEQWVNGRMSACEPSAGWPDSAAAWKQFDLRAPRRRARWLAWSAAAAAVCGAVFVLPGARVTGQRLWDQVVVGRVQVLIADYHGDGAAASFFTPVIVDAQLDPRPVASIDEAALTAGFLPRLPAPGVFSTPPAHSVAGGVKAGLRLRRPAIRYLVDRAGGRAGEVPDSWDGAVLELRIGPVAIADYDGVLLLQSLPFELITPAGFDLELFYRVAFRAMGMSDFEVWTSSRDLSINPALLMVMPEEERGLVHEFKTKSGTGVMIEEVYGPGKIAAIWSGSDRIYALFPSRGEVTKEFVVKVAGALD